MATNLIVNEVSRDNTRLHQCREEDLSSIAMLIKDTRPCPNCAVKIYKTEGCDHMFCTHCQTHFSWKTGNVLAQSTNGHYLRLQRYSENVATINECQNANLIFDDRGFETYPLDHSHFNLSKTLYQDSNEIKTMYRNKYSKTDIWVKNRTNLKGFRVKYLLGEIDYKTWSDRVYLEHKKTQQNLLLSEIFSLYLSTIDYLKTQLKSSSIASVSQSLVQLIDLCNESFLSIKKEYGGQTFQIRKINDPVTSPSTFLI